MNFKMFDIAKNSKCIINTENIISIQTDIAVLITYDEKKYSIPTCCVYMKNGDRIKIIGLINDILDYLNSSLKSIIFSYLDRFIEDRSFREGHFINLYERESL